MKIVGDVNDGGRPLTFEQFLDHPLGGADMWRDLKAHRVIELGRTQVHPTEKGFLLVQAEVDNAK